LIIFNPLGKEEIVKIVDILFRTIENKLKERDITISLTQES